MPSDRRRQVNVLGTAPGSKQINDEGEYQSDQIRHQAERRPILYAMQPDSIYDRDRQLPGQDYPTNRRATEIGALNAKANDDQFAESTCRSGAGHAFGTHNRQRSLSSWLALTEAKAVIRSDQCSSCQYSALPPRHESRVSRAQHPNRY